MHRQTQAEVQSNCVWLGLREEEGGGGRRRGGSLLTQRSEAPSGAGVAAALATGVAAAALTHAGPGDAAPG